MLPLGQRRRNDALARRSMSTAVTVVEIASEEMPACRLFYGMATSYAV
jgi:hypothetical protein